MPFLLTRALAMLVVWLSGWLVQKVPALDPATSHQVAQALVDNAWSLILSAVATGWLWLRRPGDKTPAQVAEKVAAARG
jgi:hypothetical protein